MDITKPWLTTIVSLIATSCPALERLLPNPLRQQWPHELVYVDVPKAQASGIQSVTGLGPDMEAPRPVQAETHPSQPELTRLWFIATITGAKDDKGRLGPAPTELPIRFGTEACSSPLGLQDSGDHISIDNGLVELRLRRPPKQADSLASSQHWFDGLRPSQSELPFSGSARFTGNTMLRQTRCTIKQHGPVFVDVAFSFICSEPSKEQAQSLQLLPSKRSFAGPHPVEQIPATERQYEVVIRCVVGDPWIEVCERFRFPHQKDQSAPDYHAYQIHFGPRPTQWPPESETRAPRPDTVIYLPWFEYDRFGGNNRVRILPATPRSTQKGRPFAKLGPRWHQGGGGAQDFLLSFGGQGARTDRKSKNKLPADPGYDPENFSTGFVAAYPSKWVHPKSGTIACRVNDELCGGHFPLQSPKQFKWKKTPTGDDGHFVSRCYAILAGPRRLFHDTGRLNGMVRRHSDWTLNAIINRYILKWERDPTKLGPHLLTTRQQLQQWQDEVENKPESETSTIVKRFAEKTKLKGTDKQLIQLLQGKSVKAPGLPSAGMYLATRYQDDSVNPTNFGNRTRVNRPFPGADLLRSDKPFGDANTAVIGYIYSDLDAWPGWEHGWHPGNPNFHTDKYLASAFAAACMPDHPHAADWMAFAKRNVDGDLQRVLIGEDGVGYECPGYAAYALNLQLEIAKVFFHSGSANFPVDNPLFRKTATWHRKLLTPFDKRLGLRHEAPHGDTHRWAAGLNRGFAELAYFAKTADPIWAAELYGMDLFLQANGHRLKEKRNLLTSLQHVHPGITPTPAEELDWSSQHFLHFGAVMRTGFGTEQETFVSIKAGKTHGHYHNDDLAYHYYADGTPISLDYNCSYHPRGDHAALHNSMTFGKEGHVLHNGRNTQVEAIEQIYGRAKVLGFASTAVADVLVAERQSRHLAMAPWNPYDSEFHRSYPRRECGPIRHRRWTILMKHPPESALTDYLVILDEVDATEAQQVNVHLLARDCHIDGKVVEAEGQMDKDISLFLLEADNPSIQLRGWGYGDDRFLGTGVYEPLPDERMQDWNKRMDALMQKHQVDHLPLPDWQAQHVKKGEKNPWKDRLKANKMQGLIIPKGWTGSWTYGEYQRWVRIGTAGGTPVLWALYARAKGSERPQMTTLPKGRGMTVSLGSEQEELRLISDADGQVIGLEVSNAAGVKRILPLAETD